METITNLIKDTPIPKMVKVRQNFDKTCIPESDIPGIITRELDRPEIGGKIQPGQKIAITCGSRGINHNAVMARAIVDFVKSKGAEPYIVAAMGSHGGATAEGQLQILKDYGVTEEAMGCPVKSSMETDAIERSQEGDVSNNRFEIWRDYISLAGEIGPAGLSLSNYNDYIGDQHPEMYIVRYFTDQFKDTVKTDLVYESHNNYLFVFISTGFVGAGLFLCFLVLVLVRVIRYILRHPQLSLWTITTLAVVAFGLVEALFMNSVFLKINDVSFIFWLALGALMLETEDRVPAAERTL